MQVEIVSDAVDDVRSSEGRSPEIGNHIDHEDDMQVETVSDTDDGVNVVLSEGRRTETRRHIDHGDQVQMRSVPEGVNDTRDEVFDNEANLVNMSRENPETQTGRHIDHQNQTQIEIQSDARDAVLDDEADSTMVSTLAVFFFF